ncbi:hypothetical protein V5F77_15365 [Xanthobacter sp. DSM 24535]|uniref:hypothetical protein n=1 Tax=Roseixanthobacter psychrophilus TaxID=3119917 RepID=UPI003727A478
MQDTRNLSEFERWASGLASTFIASWGIKRGGVIGVLAVAGAGALMWRATTGHCALKQAIEESPRPQRTRVDAEADAPAR